MRTMRIALGAAVAALTTLALATPASAAAVTINIKSAHLSKTAAEFDGKTCTGPFDDLSVTKDGWHFVLPAASGEDFLSLTLTFTSPAGTVPVTITGTEAAPSTGPGWSGYIDNAGSSGSDKHAYLVADAGWTLTAGSASVNNGVQEATFNLSHTCAGTPTTPSTTPTSAAPTTPVPDPTTPDPSASTSGGGNLPKTGYPLTGVVLAGLVMVATGAGLLVLRRRREIADRA